MKNEIREEKTIHRHDSDGCFPCSRLRFHFFIGCFGDTEIDTLTVASGTVITADRPATISYLKLEVSDKGKFKFGKNVTGKVREPGEASEE